MEFTPPDHSPFLPPEYIIDLVKEHLLLHVQLLILEHDMKVLQRNADLRMGTIYVRKHQQMIDSTLRQLNLNKRTLNEKPGLIKIVEMKITKGKAQCWYLYNKYEYDMMLLGAYMRADIMIRIAQMMSVDLTQPCADDIEEDRGESTITL
ncbi:hypothetical protein ACFFSY_29400 [Paenibacillus aurantiacus]|uniref:Uncharacterized protein n=1 Tax=Paenibacillus aurantiacus TaxID=1936118 RepID=A0ABV5KY05_9BACL